jgi:hypothetical protein
MGRTGWRTTAESARKVNLVRLKEWGLLPKEGFVQGNIYWSVGDERTSNINIQVDTAATVPHIRFMYRSRDWWETSENAWVSRDYSFNLESVPCRYGGKKWFIRCGLSKNGVYCGRRARVLFSIGGWYGCRNCGNITYASSNYGGRYKGFVSIPDIDAQEAKVKRRFYRGKPTRKYRKLLRLEEKFETGLIASYLSLQGVKLECPSADSGRHRTGL